MKEGGSCGEDGTVDVKFCWRVPGEENEIGIVRVELAGEGCFLWNKLFNGHGNWIE